MSDARFCDWCGSKVCGLGWAELGWAGLGWVVGWAGYIKVMESGLLAVV